MSFRPSYPDVSVGNGFVYVHPTSGDTFKHPVLVVLHKLVSEFCKANKLQFTNDEFDDNVCRNTPNIVCTESSRGAGDIIHQVLQPLVAGADGIFKTNLAGCHGCYKRQNDYNK